MIVGVAEVDAVAAPRPVRAAFDRHTRVAQPRLPPLAILCCDRESHVDRPVSVMRRYGAAGKMNRVERMAAQKQQQDAAMPDVVSAKPLVAIDAVEPEHQFVERTGALERVDVKRRLQDANESGYFVIQGHAIYG